MISIGDILYAATLAGVLTWIILKIYDFMKGSTRFHIQTLTPNQEEFKKILQRCYVLFPKDVFQFQGKTFKRGMDVRIITKHQKTIEGKLIGVNEEEVLCIVTAKYIIAHEMHNIEEMVVLKY